MSSATKHRKAFRDIVRGFSSVEYQDKIVYIKHLTPHDQVELEDITELYHNRAKSRGLPTEREMLDLLIEQGDWSAKDDLTIEKTQKYIDSMLQAKSKLVLKSAQESQNKLIQREREKLQKKINQKNELIGNTCEKYAQHRTHDFYILKSFYKNIKKETPLFTEKEYDNLTQPQITVLVSIYNEIFNGFSEESVQHLVLEDFYSPYLNFSEDSMQFYGAPFCSLTYNQIRMIVYTRIFKNIFENNANIPDHIKKDPTALLDYGSVSDEEKEKIRSKFDSGSGATIVGASKEDYEYLGVSQPVGGKSLHEEAKKKGGKLSMRDMMKLSGA